MARPANPNNKIRQVFSDYSAAALTVGTNKREFTAMYGGRVVAHCRAETAGSGTGSTQITVRVNGVSVLARTLSLAAGATGEFTGGEPAARASCRPGDRISYDVDSIPTTTAPSRFSITICVVGP